MIRLGRVFGANNVNDKFGRSKNRKKTVNKNKEEKRAPQLK